MTNFWESNERHGDYNKGYYIMYLKFAKRVDLKYFHTQNR